MIKEHKFHGVYVEEGRKKRFFTKNLVPGKTVYTEDLVRRGRDEYRTWDTKKSKLGAALAKGVSQIGIKPGNTVLYLGCASGTTPSHVSDLVGKDGFVFSLDFAPRVMREIVPVCEDRSNMCPIIADAFHPENYYHQVTLVDAVFQDIAQRNQSEIFLKNCRVFLKNGGFGILVVKARSIDQKRKTKAIFAQVRTELEREMVIVDYRTLDPFELDHCIYICKKK
ncbi:fibrillarin-like rRNA/tRNA 2'-O-methyltransferase [Candidatus Woesearchaeota archaeon]|jgi:fibrillarin-like pre-rRNA processing protein|nr:fibrillarin-like rRNA/tRNA 2'-O-methyltransferase [Candidatus Woesearchaeota archaeon]MBT3537364.1 fibrillarin-like rRNA/tRNA 2'-O-methyltransferase [Candidatus Woesearchaeota archaeon]MBT4697367.1 fibrillarin-like rRNA/tRNA 2'-O-methyltransferase [Candidatus Woesearchaeota archaeon]MBT4717680.1 fibrillarin-like rRNA/tRNA 2'-O-methyltransferase [Candidatus Woesearchaeota archaeon]MBT7106326.1 fibrillarin-like rRNA/tRNA 2'-O-methyltransferase [Candidatus Woesearchaeota archaeon]